MKRNLIVINEYIVSMNCVIIEDDKTQAQLITRHINDTNSLKLISSYPDCMSAMKNLKKLDIDILFLDVEMPHIGGLEFLEACNLQDKTHVIITTSNTKYILKAFNIGVTDFLLKPISYDRFNNAINKVIGQLKTRALKKDYMFIKHKGSFVKLMFRDIFWIQSLSEYVVIYTEGNKYMIYSSMRSILEKLPSEFIRIHRSNIISIDKIDKVDSNVAVVNGQLVKIGKKYKDVLMSRLGL